MRILVQPTEIIKFDPSFQSILISLSITDLSLLSIQSIRVNQMHRDTIRAESHYHVVIQPHSETFV